jgi:hypothetical protein
LFSTCGAVRCEAGEAAIAEGSGRAFQRMRLAADPGAMAVERQLPKQLEPCIGFLVRMGVEIRLTLFVEDVGRLQSAIDRSLKGDAAYSAGPNTASILVFSVAALNGLTM